MKPTIITLEASYLIPISYFYVIPRQKVPMIANRRYYTTSNSDPQSFDLPPVPILTFNNLNNEDCIKSYRKLLKNKGGIYSFINTVKSQSRDLLPEMKYNSNLEASIVPWFITGFVDAEGSFSASIVKNPSSRTGWRILIAFSIKLHKRDEELLKLIQLYFGCGNIYKGSKDSLVFKIVDIKQIIDTVIPQFEKFPLQTQKKADFELFERIVEIMDRKEHLISKGLQEIVNIKASLNFGVSDDLKVMFPNTKSVLRPLVESSEIPHPQWLAGFASGEGCFAVSLRKSSVYKAGLQVLLRFSLTQHSRDAELLKSLGDYLGCGKVYTSKNADKVEFIVYKLSDLVEKVLPFFQKHSIKGLK